MEYSGYKKEINVVQGVFKNIHILEEFYTRKFSNIKEIEPVQLVHDNQKNNIENNGSINRKDNKKFENKTAFQIFVFACDFIISYQTDIDDSESIKENGSN